MKPLNWRKTSLVTLLNEHTALEPEKRDLALQILKHIGHPVGDHWKYDSNLNRDEIKAILDYLVGTAKVD